MHFFESNLLKMINYSEHAKLVPSKPVPGTRTLFLINHQHLPHLPAQQQQQTKNPSLEAIKNTFKSNNYSRNWYKTNKLEMFSKKTIQM